MLSMVTAVVAWFLSGATTSVKYATGALLDVALALPSSYGLSQIRAAVFNVDQSVGGLLAVDKGWLVMGAYAVVLAVAHGRSIGSGWVEEGGRRIIFEERIAALNECL